MSKHIPTVTVGIPAYNEAANIENVLTDVLRQDRTVFHLEKIVVVSDGSTDGTVAIARRFVDRGVIVFDDGERRGLAARQNELLYIGQNSDIVVLIQADVSLLTQKFLVSIINPIVNGGADLVAARVGAHEPRTLIEDALYASHLLKRHWFEQWKNGHNIYTCVGVARAFSKPFAAAINFTESVGEDAYSYLFCRTHGFRYAYAQEAEVHIKLPDNFEDHAQQSVRFRQSRERFGEVFGSETVTKEYELPLWSLVLADFGKIFSRFGSLLLFVVVNLRVLWRSTRSKRISGIWEAASSSKKFHPVPKIRDLS